jgi:hypothetical protein
MLAPSMTPTDEASGLRHSRFVDRAVLHGEPVTFRELCRRAVPEDARFPVVVPTLA